MGLLLIILAAQQVLCVLVLTHDEKDMLEKIEKRFDRLTKARKNVFSILRKCTDEPSATIDRCLAKALLESGTKKHNMRVNRIPYFLFRIEFTCIRIGILVDKNKALLMDKARRETFPPKVLDLLRLWDVCTSAKTDKDLTAKVQSICSQELYKKLST